MSRQVQVKHVEGDGVDTVEIMAKAIVEISEGVAKLRRGPLNERALLLLIQHAAPCKSGGSRYAISEVRDILDGMENLKKMYLKSPLLKGAKK